MTKTEKLAALNSKLGKAKSAFAAKKYDQALGLVKAGLKLDSKNKDFVALEKKINDAKKKKPATPTKGKTWLEKILGKAEEFMAAVLEDGTEIMYEGELAENTIVTINVEGEEVPLPEGTHALGGDMAGTSITVDATGKVTAIDSAEEDLEEEDLEEEETDDTEDTKGASEDVQQMAKFMAREFGKINARLNKMETGFDKKVEDLADAIDKGKIDKNKFSRTGKEKTGAPNRNLTGPLA